MNVDKTIVVFPKAKANDICVKLSDIIIVKVQYCRYLGIFLDDTLTWSHHINTVYSKLMKYVGIFYKIRSKLPLSILRNIYFAFVYPHILYGIEIYADTSSIHLKKLITHVLDCRSKMLNVICALFSAVVKFVKFSCAHQNKYKAAGHV